MKFSTSSCWPNATDEIPSNVEIKPSTYGMSSGLKGRIIEITVVLK